MKTEMMKKMMKVRIMTMLMMMIIKKVDPEDSKENDHA